jgi:hypothetical protein
VIPKTLHLIYRGKAQEYYNVDTDLLEDVGKRVSRLKKETILAMSTTLSSDPEFKGYS